MKWLNIRDFTQNSIKSRNKLGFYCQTIVFLLSNGKRIVTFAIKWLLPSSSSYKPFIYMHTYMNSTCMVWGEKCFLSSKLLEQDTDNNFKSFSLHGLIAVNTLPVGSLRLCWIINCHGNRSILGFVPIFIMILGPPSQHQQASVNYFCLHVAASSSRGCFPHSCNKIGLITETKSCELLSQAEILWHILLGHGHDCKPSLRLEVARMHTGVRVT